MTSILCWRWLQHDWRCSVRFLHIVHHEQNLALTLALLNLRFRLCCMANADVILTDWFLMLLHIANGTSPGCNPLIRSRQRCSRLGGRLPCLSRAEFAIAVGPRQPGVAQRLANAEPRGLPRGQQADDQVPT